MTTDLSIYLFGVFIYCFGAAPGNVQKLPGSVLGGQDERYFQGSQVILQVLGINSAYFIYVQPI